MAGFQDVAGSPSGSRYRKLAEAVIVANMVAALSLHRAREGVSLPRDAPAALWAAGALCEDLSFVAEQRFLQKGQKDEPSCFFGHLASATGGSISFPRVMVQGWGAHCAQVLRRT